MRKKYIAIFLVLILVQSKGGFCRTAASFHGELEAMPVVAVLDLIPTSGVEASEARLFTEMIRTEVFKTKAFKLINRDDMERIADSNAILLSDCADEICLGKLANALKARNIIVGEIGLLFGQYNVNLRLVSVDGESAFDEMKISHVFSSEQVQDASRYLAAELTGRSNTRLDRTTEGKNAGSDKSTTESRLGSVAPNGTTNEDNKLIEMVEKGLLSYELVATVPIEDTKVFSVDFDPNDLFLAVSGATNENYGTGDGVVFIYDVSTFKLSKTLRLKGGCFGGVRSVRFSPNGDMLAVACGRWVCIWNVPDWNFKKCYKTVDALTFINSLDFSPTGKYLILGTSGNRSKAILWSVNNGEIFWEKKLSGDEGPDVARAVFSPSGKRIATTTGHDDIVILDINGEEILEIDTDECNYSIDYHPNGVIIASGSWTEGHCRQKKEVRLWNGNSGSEMMVLKKHNKNGVSAISFSPKGSFLASGGSDNCVRLWRTSDGAQLDVLAGHKKRVRTIEFNSDGTLLVSGSEDKTAKIWRAIIE